MVFLDDILKAPRYSELTTLTSTHTLTQQPIESVEITETPDVKDYIPENVLILTTALFFKDDQKHLLTFIKSLKEAKAVGLGIKINRFLGKIDQEVINFANSISFPIFTIPDNYTLGSLLHQIMNLVLDNQKEEIDYALDMQRAFSELLLHDASNKRLVDELSKSLTAPVVLLSPYNTIEAKSKYFEHKDALAQEYIRLLNQRQDELGKFEGPFVIKGPTGKVTHLSVVKIQTYSYYFNYLVIFNTNQIPTPFSIFALEQAAMIFSYSMFKNIKVNDAQFEEEAKFFNQLIDTKIDSNKNLYEWLDLSKNFGYKKSDYYRIIHISNEKMLTNAMNDKLTYEELYLSYTWLRENLDHYFTNAQVIWSADTREIILVLQSKPDKLENALMKIREKLAKTLNTKLVYNIGKSYTSLNQIKTSYTQAQIIDTDRKKHSNFSPIIFYEENGIQELLNNISNNEIQYFCNKTLKELAYPTEESKIELRNTLKTYLDNQCEITQTAKELFIHRNTVKYRIQKCEDILGIMIESSKNSLSLRLALDLS